MELTLRKAGLEDVDDCSKLDQGSLIHDRYFSEEGSFARSLYRGVEAGQLYVAVTEQGKVAGLMKVVIQGFCGVYPYLSLVSVSEAYRGQGVGSFLLSRFEEMGREAGARKAALLVSDFNLSAKRLYERRGYKEIGLISDAVKDGIGEYLMLKDL